MPLVRKPSGTAPASPLTLLTAKTSDERWAAARAAAERPDGVTLLAKALALEQEPRVRTAIFNALARIATVDSADAVVPYLRSEDAGLRAGAVDALRAMPLACAHHLPSLLGDLDPDVRLLSCELVRGLPDVDANRLLCNLLGSESERNVCAAALEVLAEVGLPEALPCIDACARRFAGDPFIAFSIKVASDRIRATAQAT